MKDNFIFNSYVSVSKHFKNKGIATKMMLISMDIAKKNNLIYVRSKPTNEGSLCIEKKIDKQVNLLFYNGYYYFIKF